MQYFVLDTQGLIFLVICVPIATWVALDTQRWLRAGNLNRRTSFRRSEILTLRVPAAFAAIVGAMWILFNVVARLAHR